MKTSDLIKQFEGLKLKAYLCPAGVWTIGYGHTKGVKEGDIITQEQADKFLEDDLKYFEAEVNRLVKVKLGENQRAAIVSFVYNVGVGNFQSSTMLKRINEGKNAADQFIKWVYAKGKVSQGLVNRRKKEREIYEMDINNT